MLLWKTKILLGIDEDDCKKNDIIETLIEICKDFASEYCGVEYTEQMDNVVVQMVVYRYGRLGAESLTAESYSGASFSYADDYPAEVYVALNNIRKRSKGSRFI